VIVIVGAGLTGLATAWRLRDLDDDVVLLEASERVGGQIDTAHVAGAPFDVGADAMLVRQPEAERLARELGFREDELVAPATGKVHLWTREALRPLPTATVMGVPTDLRELARSGALSAAGVARAALEPTLPRRTVIGDRSVADLVGERFGREVVEGLVEPLLGGVYAGRTDRLSAAAALAPVWSAAQRHRSLLTGLRAHRRAGASATGPVFRTVRGGLSRLTARLAEALGPRLWTGVPVRGVRRDEDGWVVDAPGATLVADHLVLAVPARVAARLLVGEVPDVAAELAPIRTASVATVALAYERTAGATLPDGSGILVPPREGRLVKAVTFASRKWPHHADRDVLLLRASVGRVPGDGADRDHNLDLDDPTLAERVDAEVRWATGLPRPAVERTVRRWPDALPQYEVGHRERLARIRHALHTQAPGLHLAGASFDGLGLAARAREAEQLSHHLRGAVTGAHGPGG
jgi:protoporphyrinogen/coproporphyrinogen III oxidase